MDANIKLYRSRIRIFLIIYFFSDNYSDTSYPKRLKVLKDEVRIQKIDFLIRYPDYLAYELLETIPNNNKTTIKQIVSSIFKTEEPIIRKDEMEKYLFGAWEAIDDSISFLKSLNLIDFESKKYTDGKVGQKFYYLTELGKKKVEQNLSNSDALQWYINRCQLIKKYFGNLSGKELRLNQYKHKEYENTPYKEYIKGIEAKVRSKYYHLFNEEL